MESISVFLDIAIFPPNPLAAPKMPILNRVKRRKYFKEITGFKSLIL